MTHTILILIMQKLRVDDSWRLLVVCTLVCLNYNTQTFIKTAQKHWGEIRFLHTYNVFAQIPQIDPILFMDNKRYDIEHA